MCAAMNAQASYNSALRIQNSLTTPVCLRLEPWGEEIAFPAGAMFNILASGPVGDCLEVEHQPECVVVYGWPGSTLRVFDGEILVQDCSIPVPPTPLRAPLES